MLSHEDFHMQRKIDETRRLANAILNAKSFKEKQIE
jgi:hypothetical protein